METMWHSGQYKAKSESHVQKMFSISPKMSSVLYWVSHTYWRQSPVSNAIFQTYTVNLNNIHNVPCVIYWILLALGNLPLLSVIKYHVATLHSDMSWPLCCLLYRNKTVYCFQTQPGGCDTHVKSKAMKREMSEKIVYVSRSCKQTHLVVHKIERKSISHCKTILIHIYTS